MARMYPSQLPRHILDNPKLSSERRVYDRIRDTLPGDYTCYYSRSWHEADDAGAEFDGEADFIIAHPQHGLLFLEVKGGRVSCREADGQWLSEDRDGFRFQIKNPLAQARSSKHHFLRRLNSTRKPGGCFLRARHGAVLPGSTKPARPLGPDAPPDIIAFGNDMERLDRWIIRRMTEGGDPREQPLGADGLRALDDLLAGHFELKAHIGTSLADDVETIERLTAEQAWILDSLEDNRQMAISGGAGSGKTVLAIETAIRSAARGNRTLLTCYNAPLARYLLQACGQQENLVIAGFHSLCRQIAGMAEITLPVSAGRALFDIHLPEALIEAVCQKPELGFDAVIIDEGQDFHDAWLNALRLSLKNGDEGGFYVFYDDNQRLFSGDTAFIGALPQSVIALTRNLRNTRRIHALMSKWYEGRRFTAAGPEGEPVSITEIRRGEPLLARISERIAQLIRSGQVAAGDIAVLTGSRAGLQDPPEKIAGVPICRADSIIEGHIVYDTVRRFKGLSRPCVFVVDLEDLTDPELIYVATSRANLLLQLTGTAEDIARITTNT